jgi:aspartate dehydrogenase
MNIDNNNHYIFYQPSGAGMNVGIIGCGFIGNTLANAIEGIDEIDKLYLFDHTISCTEGLASSLTKAISTSTIDDFLENVDLAIESGSQSAVQEFGLKVLEHGKDLMIMSIGALEDDALWKGLQEAAKKNKCQIYLPSGAICGIDGIKSASMAGIDEVIVETTKPPKGLEKVRYITKQGIDISKLKEPLEVFSGTAREAVKHFPRNINISACVSLAGIGFDKTKVKIIIDPAITRNQHKLICRGRFGEFICVVQNMPSISNPKTSYLAALSAIATLKNIVSGVWIGT